MTPAQQDALFRSLHIHASKGWLTLAIAGQGSTAYDLRGSADQTVNEVDRFAEALKAALRGEPLPVS